jgi:phage terminase large subunit-like protein
MEASLVFGPGDLRGQPYRLDDEKRRLIWRIYEVYPREHPHAGRRRFRRVAISLRKGSAKTELGAAIAAVELADDGPVRTDGWHREGRHWLPVGRPVTDPYIPMLAYTEQQSEELAYAALYVMLSEGPRSRAFDFGLERIMRVNGDGKAAALSTAPDTRDGARTTFELFDETHRLVLPRQKEAHRTMLANLPKRRASDAWALEVTTAPKPGEGSVAEDTMDYARQVADGAKADARLYFFHRQASEGHELTTHDGIRAAVVEASGPVAEWSDIDGIVEQWDDPSADRSYLARVWLNMLVRSEERAFDAVRWAELRTDRVPEPKALITLGYDGSRVEDWSALIATEVRTGYQWPLPCPASSTGVTIWDPHEHGGEVPRDQVDLAVEDAFERYRVWLFYVDPPYWKDELAAWQGKHGPKVVEKWETWRNRPMGFACRAYATAIRSGAISHGGDKLLTAAVGACHRAPKADRDDKGEFLWTVQKERPESPHKIDAAVAAILSWEARMTAIAGGALTAGQRRPSVFNDPEYVPTVISL